MNDETVRCPVCAGSMRCIGKDSDDDWVWLCSDCGHIDFIDDRDPPDDDIDNDMVLDGHGEDPFDV